MPEMELEVFRAGDYGDKGSYGPGDLDALAGDYDPQLHEAPVTIDHAQTGPAYGWVKGLHRVGDRLVASLRDISDEFLSWLKKGTYRKRSIELYRRFTATGRPYLRAVSFLGACPPEVKGLTDPVFEDEGEFVHVDFRDEIETVEDTKEEPQPETKAPLDDDIARERDELKKEIAALREEKRRAELAFFCDRLKREGRLIPAWEEKGLLEFMLSLDENRTVSFEEEMERTPLEWFLSFLEELPAFLCLEELAGETEQPETDPRSLPKPGDGVTVSPESLDIHQRALGFCEKHPECPYPEALARVSRVK